MVQHKQNPEPWMNGAAIVLSDGREVPITDTMVRQTLDQILKGQPERPAESRKTA
ncbi:MAG: hypothetical protein R3276_16365 [Marinobacter sp.]|nr:hypothetical protein [Marinobacter sp.]